MHRVLLLALFSFPGKKGHGKKETQKKGAHSFWKRGENRHNIFVQLRNKHH